jgi:hypothetical protein
MFLLLSWTKWRGIPWLAVLLYFVTVSPLSAREKLAVGWVEPVAIAGHGIVLAAKIDTGAQHSSLHAPDPNIFHKNGESWVKFSVTVADGGKIQFEEQVVRMTKIKRKGFPAEVRPVVQMKICLANVEKSVEVNLVDRENFEHPVLVGRSFLTDSFVVDVSKQQTTTPHCIGYPQRGAVADPGLPANN